MQRAECSLRNVYEQTILRNRFIPPNPDTGKPRPHPKQAAFLAYLGREALYGGAAGGGKSDALLMGALQFVEHPGYSALLLRRTFRHLMQDGGLVQRAHQWLHGKAHWSDSNKRWTFPTGSTLTFGYLDHERDLDNYHGGAWQFIGFDELSQFPEKSYRYLFSRLRKLVGVNIPVRMRAGSNPGNIGHEWVKKRFVPDAKRPGDLKKHFVSAKLHDNPSLDAGSYIQSLNELDPITRAQLLAGDWDAYEGGRFRAEWFREFEIIRDPSGNPIVTLIHPKTGAVDKSYPLATCWTFIICDPAARAEEVNDYTAIGVFMVTPAGEVLVMEMVRDRIAVEKIVPRIGELVEGYSPLFVGIEDTAFQVLLIREAQRTLGVSVQSLSPEGKSKLVRATPAIIRASEGQIYLPVRGPKHVWIEDFVAECVQFTGDPDLDSSDDQVDTLAHAILALSRHGLSVPTVIQPDEEREYRGGGMGIFNA